MKKLLLLFILTLAPILWAQAQYTRFGAKAGGNFTTVKGDDGSSDYANNLAGLHGGLIAGYEFVSRLALQGELLYEQKGFVYDDYALNATELVRGDYRLHYLTLPVMLKIQKGGLFAEGGPYVGYLLAENTDLERIESGTASSPEPTVLGNYPLGIDDFNRWDYGYTIGIGLQLNNGLFMSLHNTGGLTSFSKALDQKNFGFKVSIGYFFRSQTAEDLMWR